MPSRLSFGPAGAPFELDAKPVVVINAQKVAGAERPEYRWLLDRLRSAKSATSGRPAALDQAICARSTDCRGPIDDAFMDSFVFVKPTGLLRMPPVAKWVDAEQNPCDQGMAASVPRRSAGPEGHRR